MLRRCLARHSPLLSVFVLVACGDDAPASSAAEAASSGASLTAGVGGTGGAGGDGGDAAGPAGSGAGGQGSSVGQGGSPDAVATSSGTGGGSGGGDGALADPEQDGPYQTAELTGTTPATDGTDMPLFVAYPTSGPTSGPHPVVVVAHGFQLPAAQYASYVRRLATHGFVALTVDYPAGFFGVNHVESAMDLLAGLDWVQAEPTLMNVADVERAGMTGHSLGGKLALLAATMDERVKATITLDPVDGSMSCSPQDCPDVSDLMPLDIPTGFLGETIDASGGFQSCAPAADNYTTFYAGTTSPSLEVTVVGANHMSFLDDVASCGFTCSLCNPPTADNAAVNGLARAYVVAFYRRWLGGEAGYDAYLTGDIAQERYVAPGRVTLQSR